ncbi:hypothetical protein FRC11_011645 [Ceratobasidium sp. 423]|nr:hypothetical protein FRC11_011645 [Ceratobasidium sp. 423]
MFDKNGRLVSDHPAMHDEAFNTDSFAKRASPNRNRLPPSFSTNVFCHTCQTNQTLTMNLLSNYLPPSSDPSYSKRLAEYPAYKESLYVRYPPVCANCQPGVDERIRQKDSMAKSAALGGWLQASARRSKSPGTGFGEKPPGTGTRQVVIWNIRGVLCAQQTTDVPSFSGLSLSTFSPTRPTRTVNPIFGVASLPQSQPRPQLLSGEYGGVDPSDAMDWTPATGYTKDEAAELLRPARFAPEKPTGLEGLIEKFGIGGDEAEQPATNQASGDDSGGSGLEKGVVIGILAGLGLVGVVAFIVTWWPQWLSSQQASTQVLTPQHIVDDL